MLDLIIGALKSKKGMRSGFQIGGVMEFVCYDPQGNVKWKEVSHNIIPDAMINHILDVVFHNDTGSRHVHPWYVGLKNAGTPVVGDTLASHASWTENTNYTGDRKEYQEAAASSKSTTNAANKASFAINADSQTIAGGFLASVATGTSGVLGAVVDFGSAKQADNGDTLEVTYTIDGEDDGE